MSGGRSAQARHIMTALAAASFFSNICNFGGCGLAFNTLAELIEHIEDIHIGRWESDAGWHCILHLSCQSGAAEAWPGL